MHEKEVSGWYSAFKAKDARFDGRFFVGVSSTGIYCRPVCRARLPKEENCTFYATAAAAEQAGYRPCLLCRPELAPGLSVTDATEGLAHRAAVFMQETCCTGESLNELASRLGYTPRHLRRAFIAAYHVPPVRYLQTCRLLLAKNLLTSTRLSVLQVAMFAGFGSVRRFNAVFQKQYRLSPTALRKQTETEGGNQEGEITLPMGYRPPYRWGQILAFLAGRALPGVEKVTAGAYWRTVHMNQVGKPDMLGWVRVQNDARQNALLVTVSASLLPVLPRVLARLRHLFDVNAQPDEIYNRLAALNSVKPGLNVLGTRLPGCFDGFEMAVKAVLGQQISVKAAQTLAGRLAKAYGRPVSCPLAGLTHAFPTPGALLALWPPEKYLGPMGITSARARAVYALAEGAESGALSFSVSAQPHAEIKKLLALPGIGRWTASYIAMRAMAWPDAFLETDAVIKKELAPLTEKEMLRLAENWRPWRSYATLLLWEQAQKKETEH